MSLCPLRNENINVLLVGLIEIVKNQGSSTLEPPWTGDITLKR